MRLAITNERCRQNDLERAVSDVRIDQATCSDGPLPAQRLDKVYGFKGWNVRFPSFSDTVLKDSGGWRTKLAEHGVGFLTYNMGVFAQNMLDVPRSSFGRQTYWGQKGSYLNTAVSFITYDLSRIGIRDGQLQLSATNTHSTWQPYAKSNTSLNGLSYYQPLLDDRLELKIGYVANSVEFVGSFIGGNLASPFGVSAGVPYQLGISLTGQPAPTARLTLRSPSGLYNQFAVQRSLSPTAASYYDSVVKNPSGARFTVRGWKQLYINELGYKVAAAPHAPYTWLRIGSMLNTSAYRNHKSGGMDHNYGAYALADRQMWQKEPSSAASAHKGLYLGFTGMYAPPSRNTFSQNYEARFYGIGLLPSRPIDMISLVYSHNVISDAIVDLTTESSHITGRLGRASTNTFTLSYTGRVRPGVWATFGAAYTDHPTISSHRDEGSAFNALASLLVTF